jgi:NAD(P)-dependent dehydrogenase (short-subunit alcohol dehydrogenase family)
LVWVSSSSVRGGTPPYLAPYFAAKAAMDSLAVSYAGELARWGIERSIIVPGAFTKGTSHFAHAGAPADRERAAEYQAGPTRDLPDLASKGLAALEPPDADVTKVAEAIAEVVAAPFGKRPFRVHIDPSQDGAEIVNGVADRVRAELLRRIGLADILKPSARAAQPS